jgi:putative oxidoreductase
MGIWLVHAPLGWFVVGASTGGMEFSVTLVACLSGVLWAYWPRK